MRHLRLESPLTGADGGGAFPEPLRVLPLMPGNVPDDGSGLVQRFGLEREGIRLEARRPVPSGHGEFIETAVERFLRLHRGFPHARFGDAFEGFPLLPVREIGHESDGGGIGGPCAEDGFVPVLRLLPVTAEIVVYGIVRPLMEKICGETGFPGGAGRGRVGHIEHHPFPAYHYTLPAAFFQEYFAGFVKNIF